MRSCLLGEVGERAVGGEVTVCGWVNTRRDHGGVIFIDLRDASGVLQMVASPDNAAVFAVAERVRSEFVLQARGAVRRRQQGAENTALATGTVELDLRELTILNAAAALPFLPNDTVNEDTRLRHRVIDLRGERMQNNLRLRHKFLTSAREWLNAAGFIEVDTPMLTRATPEGARDFLIPSRLQGGDFYALPQSPQLFKQMLMAAGVDRYFQVARCFRDEDLRADRQPEFSQIDIEMAFVNEDDVMAAMETMMATVFAAVGATLPTPFPRMSWAQAMREFGCDRPDLRNPLRLTDLTDLMLSVEFKVFRAGAESGRVAALRAPGGAAMSRKEIDELTAFVGEYGAGGLAYIKCQNVAARELQSPIIKFLPDDCVGEVLRLTQAADGDILFFGAGEVATVNAAMAALRGELGRRLRLTATGEKKPLWVVDFPMFEWDGARWSACHHPFTAPQGAIEKSADCLSRAYDMVIDGVEVGGGSIRIHDAAAQREALAVLGIDADEAQAKFGFLLEALAAGAPPHGGIAFGVDRIVAMLCGADSIRDVIAFPKTQRGQCLLTGAPAAVSDGQLRELSVRALKAGR